MKYVNKILILFGVILLNLNVSGQKKLEKRFVPLNDTLYVSKYEERNIDFNYYVQSLNDSDDLTSFPLDTANWHDMGFNGYMCFVYHIHPAYYLYPVNVRYQTVLDYCVWLSNTYNSSKSRKFTKVKFRLPTYEEWITLAGYSTDSTRINCRLVETFYWGNNRVYSEAGEKQANFRVPYEYQIEPINFPIMATDQLGMNPYGLYHFHGNVGEMIAEKNQSVGGSYMTMPKEVTPISRFVYDQSNCYTGFRLVMEIIEH